MSIVSTFQLQAQCVDNGNYWNQSWVSCETSPNPNPERGESFWILYEFESAQPIKESQIWNANRTGESGWGANEVVIDYTTDDNPDWMELGQYNFPQAPETDDYTGFPGPDFGSQFITKILVTILNTHDGSNCASLAEMQFKIDPTACNGVVDECGVCDGLGAPTWFADADGDGLGDVNNITSSCTQPEGYVENNSDLCDDGRPGWINVAPLFANHGCLNCHGGGAQGGLDLRTFASTASGGDLCGPNILLGSHMVEIITFNGYSGCGTVIPLPAMNNRVSNPMDDDALNLLQHWINGGAPEICTDYCANFQAEIPYNGINDDCDVTTLDDDLDQDGFILEVDCDDTNPDINPNAMEIPDNGIDEDCDGMDATTSILTLSDATIQIYPNPTINIINIDVTGYLDYSATLFSIEGKILLEQFTTCQADCNSPMQISNLPSGSYLLEIRNLDNGEKVVKRILKVSK